MTMTVAVNLPDRQPRTGKAPEETVVDRADCHISQALAKLKPFVTANDGSKSSQSGSSPVCCIRFKADLGEQWVIGRDHCANHRVQGRRCSLKASPAGRESFRVD